MTNWVWHDPATEQLRGNAFVALMALADIADDDGHVIYAKGEKRSQSALAKKARMSVATFRRMTDELAKKGLLEVTRESQRTENAYRLMVTAQSERSQVSGQPAQSERSERSSSERSSASTPLKGHRDIDDVAAPKRGTRIPEPFMLTAEMKAWAVQEVPGLDVTAHTREFVDHWRAASGQSAVKRDWVAAWRNWMRKAHRWQGPREGSGPSTEDFAPGDEWMAFNR